MDRDQTAFGQNNGNAHGGGAAVNQGCQSDGKQDACQGSAREGDEDLAEQLIFLKRRHRVDHDLEREEDEAETKDGISDAFIKPVGGE
ncbi:MAG: hypothetical protein A2010_08220 [Nitrospirae bacterium GWD2_57_9]|nr:MAG: hypothetical protein A2010_08220 [Nitrospirae bacterium GWD2_57_9]